MTITIKLTTDNAAFEDDKDAEIGRLVHRVAQRLERGAIASGIRETQALVDLNGNRVGSVTVRGK